MMRSIIVGGLGLVGRALTNLLLEKEQEVVILDPAPPTSLAPDIRDRVEIVRTDWTFITLSCTGETSRTWNALTLAEAAVCPAPGQALIKMSCVVSTAVKVAIRE